MAIFAQKNYYTEPDFGVLGFVLLKLFCLYISPAPHFGHCVPPNWYVLKEVLNFLAGIAKFCQHFAAA